MGERWAPGLFWNYDSEPAAWEPCAVPMPIVATTHEAYLIVDKTGTILTRMPGQVRLLEYYGDDEALGSWPDVIRWAQNTTKGKS
jgi:hypothetical protein